MAVNQQQINDQNPLFWDGIDDAGEGTTAQLRRAATEQYLLDLAYFNTFNTPDGKKVLEHLYANTCDAATWMPSLGYKKAIAHGFAREGQNAMVRNTMVRIERIRNARTLDDYLNKAGVEPKPKPLAAKVDSNPTPAKPKRKPRRKK